MAAIAAAIRMLWMQALLVWFLQLRICCAAPSFNPACPSALISLGDSSADTGNAEIVFPLVMPAQYPPYGMTYFHRPANRFSDGRLVIDFMAQALNLPLLEPDLGQSSTATLSRGINFAVAGAVAIGGSESQLSFSAQIERFHTLVNSEANRGNRVFSGALYVISIGTNDFYNSLAVEKMSEEDVRGLIAPQVIDAIANAVRNIYNQGGRNFVVVNVYAQGCTPATLTLVDPLNVDAHDQLGCLPSYNQVIEDYNKQLKQTVYNLIAELEGVNIAYADVYQALMNMLSNPQQYGFQDATKLDACCGSGGTHNYDATKICGEIANICSNPSSYISWDGIHLTEAAYRVIARGVITGQYLDPPVNSSSTCHRP
ncbi:hypothetical protein O6H91_16G091500 [Diphasiastrum complanatum]|uniref:Uncharacterized protein n=1 Tax=Diphasiastrum complanatum TaxID=34168 RepID=A0ACC2BES0_DIPCM|nr:hypothetical protein O6H91_16G091500 [Diphasiastrum complanatum]